MNKTMEERLAEAIRRPAPNKASLDGTTNIHLASVSPDNPLFVITSRQPAHIACLETPDAVFDWLLCQLADNADDPSRALDFEIVDLARS